MASEKPPVHDELLTTKESREQVAAAMVSPRRCGGLDYIDNLPYYRVQGKLFTVDEWEKKR